MLMQSGLHKANWYLLPLRCEVQVESHCSEQAASQAQREACSTSATSATSP